MAGPFFGVPSRREKIVCWQCNDNGRSQERLLPIVCCVAKAKRFALRVHFSSDQYALEKIRWELVCDEFLWRSVSHFAHPFPGLIGSGKVCLPKGLLAADSTYFSSRVPLAVFVERGTWQRQPFRLLGRRSMLFCLYAVALRRAMTRSDRPSLGRCLLVRATEISASEDAGANSVELVGECLSHSLCIAFVLDCERGEARRILLFNSCVASAESTNMLC